MQLGINGHRNYQTVVDSLATSTRYSPFYPETNWLGISTGCRWSYKSSMSNPPKCLICCNTCEWSEKRTLVKIRIIAKHVREWDSEIKCRSQRHHVSRVTHSNNSLSETGANDWANTKAHCMRRRRSPSNKYQRRCCLNIHTQPSINERHYANCVLFISATEHACERARPENCPLIENTAAVTRQHSRLNKQIHNAPN